MRWSGLLGAVLAEPWWAVFCAHRYEVNQMLDHVPAMVYSYMVHENNENSGP